MINYSYILKTIIGKAAASLELISEAEFDKKSFPKKWSKKEILGHLIDSAINNIPRITNAGITDTYIFSRYDQDKWVTVNDYTNRFSKDLIELWSSLNNHLGSIIATIPQDTLRKKTTSHNFDEICMLMVEKGSQSSLSYLIWDYIYHTEHHLSQIISNYEYELTKFEDD